MITFLKLNIRIFLQIFIFLFFCQCQKDKLKNKYAVLEGKWRWNKSITAFIPSKTTYYDTAFAVNTPNIYEIEFLKKGELHLIKDNNVLSIIKLKIDKEPGTYCSDYDENSFCFSDYKNHPRLYYMINGNELIGWNYPNITSTTIPKEHIQNQYNYFTKIN